MKTLTILIGLLCLLTVHSCQKAAEVDQISTSLLLGCWMHSYEEETETSDRIYRRCDFIEFPLSRYRNRFKLEETGNALYSVLAPNDAHYSDPGSWVYNAAAKLLEIKNLDGQAVREYEVVEVQENKLILKH